MTGLRRTLGLVVALTALNSSVWALRVDELQDSFNQGVEQLRRGRNDEALKTFKKLLAASPTQEQAYALWKETDWSTWRELLGEGGEFELVAKRLMELARVARKEHRNDTEAIQALVKDVTTGTDALARRKSVNTLAAAHGEYAVPYLLPLLGGETGGDEDRRVLAMHTLTRMSTDVVPPLCEALHSEDAVLRRNVALVLGNIGDPRAAGMLAWVAGHDSDAQARSAAAESIKKMNGRTDALANFLTLGDDYHHRRDAVLRDQDYSDVVWDWKDGKLVATPVPRFLYNDEMAKKSYDAALQAAPTSIAALAGLARAHVDEETKLGQLESAGKDVGASKEHVAQARLLVNAAGVDALDLALTWSVESSDASTAGALCRVLAPMAKAPTAGLEAALRSNDGGVRSEAAVALGWIAAASGRPASPAVVDVLGEAAGREILRLALVIDADAQASGELSQALGKQGIFVSNWNTGAKGVTMARRAPGLDIVLVADTLPDITTAQVIDELRSDERTQNVPILLVTKDPEAATGAYGDRISGTLSGAADLKAVETALEKNLAGDRALADELSVRAANVLARLAQSGHTNIAGALASLAQTLPSRPDRVILPALQVLELAGAPGHAAALVAVLADEKRSDDARVAGANALAGVLGRAPEALASEGQAQVEGVVLSNASLPVREAAARALGVLKLDAATRAALLRKLSAGAGTTSG